MDTGSNGLSSGVEHATDGAESTTTTVEASPPIQETPSDATIAVEATKPPPPRTTLLDDVLTTPPRIPETIVSVSAAGPTTSSSSVKTSAPTPSVLSPSLAKIESPTPFAFHPPDGFNKMPQSLFHYSPAHCKGRSVFGVLVDALDIQLREGSQKALVVQLVEPTLVLLQDGKSVVEIGDGHEVFVFADFYLRPLIRRALDKESVGEIWMRPTKGIVVDGGGIIYGWELYYGKTYPRSKIKRMPKGNVVL